MSSTMLDNARALVHVLDREEVGLAPWHAAINRLVIQLSEQAGLVRSVEDEVKREVEIRMSATRDTLAFVIHRLNNAVMSAALENQAGILEAVRIIKDLRSQVG